MIYLRQEKIFSITFDSKAKNRDQSYKTPHSRSYVKTLHFKMVIIAILGVIKNDYINTSKLVETRYA
jgi:hypothetical protein